MIKKNHSFQQLAGLALLLIPMIASAQDGSDMGGGQVLDMIQYFVKWLFIDAGPWIALLGIGGMLLMGYFGHMDWKKVIMGVLVLAVFFALPKLVGKLKENAQGNLDSLGSVILIESGNERGAV